MTKFGGWGWFLRKQIDPHPRVVEVGILGGSKNQKSGKCHELSRKSLTKKLTHPPWGVPGGLGVEVGILGESTNQKSGKCHELSRKLINNFFLPTHPGGVSGGGSNFQKCGKFHELARKSIKKILPEKCNPPPRPIRRGWVGGGRGRLGAKISK